MKKLLVFLLAVSLTYCFQACDQKNVIPKKFPKDTIITSVLYAHAWAKNDYRAATAARWYDLNKSVDPQDSSRIIMIVDTFYNVLSFKPVLDSVTRETIKDSAGNLKGHWEWLQCPKNLILQDYNKEWVPTPIAKK